jgi:hypothetical protein
MVITIIKSSSSSSKKDNVKAGDARHLQQQGTNSWLDTAFQCVGWEGPQHTENVARDNI